MKNVFLILLIFNITVFASENYSGLSNLPIGARASSITAYTSIADTNDTIHANPAGLYNVQSTSSLHYSKYFNEINYYWLTQNFNFKYYSLAIGLASMQVNGIQQYDIQGSYIKDFSFSDSILFLSHSTKLDKIMVGSSLKIQQQAALESNVGYSLDVGLLYKDKEINIGFISRNLIKTRIGKDSLVTDYQVGISTTLNNTLIAVDLKYIPSLSHAYTSIGLESSFNEFISFIVGINHTNYHLGARLNFNGIQINYHYTPHVLKNISEISLEINLF